MRMPFRCSVTSANGLYQTLWYVHADTESDTGKWFLLFMLTNYHNVGSWFGKCEWTRVNRCLRTDRLRVLDHLVTKFTRNERQLPRPTPSSLDDVGWVEVFTFTDVDISRVDRHWCRCQLATLNPWPWVETKIADEKPLGWNHRGRFTDKKLHFQISFFPWFMSITPNKNVFTTPTLLSLLAISDTGHW